MTPGEQRVYDDSRPTSQNDMMGALIRGSARTPGAVQTVKPASLKDQIMQKVADQGFDSLTKGEQRIYNDVIKKQSGGAPAVNGKTAVLDPQGNPGYIPTKNLEKALQAGYKLR